MILRAKKESNSSHSHRMPGHFCLLFHLALSRSPSNLEWDPTLTKVMMPPLSTKCLTAYGSLCSTCSSHSTYNTSFSSTLYQWEQKCWQAPSSKSDLLTSFLNICQDNFSHVIACKYATTDPIRSTNINAIATTNSRHGIQMDSCAFFFFAMK